MITAIGNKIGKKERKKEKIKTLASGKRRQYYYFKLYLTDTFRTNVKLTNSHLRLVSCVG